MNQSNTDRNQSNIDRFREMGLVESDVSLTSEEENAINQLSAEEMQQIEDIRRRLAGQLSATDTQTIERLRRRLQPVRDKVIIPAWF